MLALWPGGKVERSKGLVGLAPASTAHVCPHALFPKTWDLMQQTKNRRVDDKRKIQEKPAKVFVSSTIIRIE